MGHVVVDADREVVAGLGAGELVEDGLHHPRAELLRREPVAPGDHGGHAAVRRAPREGGQHVQVQRLAGRAGLLRAVEHRAAPHRPRERREKRSAANGR
jgi:hypothetical protein